MNRIERTEARCGRINRILFALYYLLSAAMIAVYAVRRDGYHLGISLGTLAIPLGLALLYRLFHLPRIHQLDFLVLAFTLLAYPLGSCLGFYARFPGYDKLVHMLSGAFVSLLCILLYCALKPGHRIEKQDLPLAILFTFFGSMTVAGLWELGEYAISLLTGRDVQHAIDTGVGDTMQDMLVCMLGTLATLPLLQSVAMGRHSFLTGPVDAFLFKLYPHEG